MDEPFKSILNDALFTDFYELTMAQGYWKNNMDTSVVFDVFFRKQPFNGGFSVFAGLEDLIDAITDFTFSESDIDYLRSKGVFEEDFLSYLKSFKFSGDIYAFEEGSVVFPQEPIVRIHAKLIEAQILEGLTLNIINFQSLVATKAARVWLASREGHIMEFGLRRAQGPDGAMSATRASFIGGVEGTSNTLAGKLYGIPVMGTMAHSWVMAFPTELEAFRAYAKIFPEKSIFLIDTYDTLNSGIKNAIIVGKELAEKGYNFGVRLDSGDISYLTQKVRKELDDAGFRNATITVSNELTEEIIETLVQQNCPIDTWGVGTNMVTGGSESSFTGVYKLCAKKDLNSEKMHPVMKFSDNPEKNTNPGVKSVFRLYDEAGNAKADVIALEGECIESNKEYRYFHTMTDYRQFAFTAAKIVPMLKKIVQKGSRVEAKLPSDQVLLKAKENMKSQLKTFDASYKRILNPHIYKVSLTENLRNMKLEFIKARIK